MSDAIQQNKDIIAQRSEVDLARLVLNRANKFNHVNVATALHRLAKLCKGSSGVWGSETAEALDRLETQCVRVVQDMVGQGVANALWSLATLGRSPSSELLAALAARFRALERDLLPQNISNFLVALSHSRGAGAATLKVPPPDKETIPFCQRAALRIAAQFKAQEVANLVWALATLGAPLDGALADALGRNAERLWSSLTPQNIANILWALAILRVRPDAHRPLVRVLLECAVRGLADQGVAWSSQHIGNLLWALATLQERPPAALAKAVATRMDFAEEHFKPQEVANALWGWASLGLSGASLAVIRWTQHALRLASSFKPQDIANVLWALGQLQHYPGRELLEALCERIVSQADHFNAQDVANSLSSFGCLEVTPRPAALVSLCEAACRLAKKMSTQHLATSLWTLATLGLTEEVRAMLQAPERESLERTIETLAAAVADLPRSEFHPELACLVAWSAAVLEHFPVGLLRKVAEVMSINCALEDVGRRQLHQFLLSCRLEPRLEGLVRTEPSLEALLTEEAQPCLECFTRQSRDATESKMQQAVSQALRQRLPVGSQVVDEFVDATTGYSIDCYIPNAPLPEGTAAPAGDKGVAVEVDGPHHFLRNSRRLQGRTIIKHMHLRRAGFRVVSVSYHDWDRPAEALAHSCDGSDLESARSALLRQLLAPHTPLP